MHVTLFFTYPINKIDSQYQSFTSPARLSFDLHPLSTKCPHIGWLSTLDGKNGAAMNRAWNPLKISHVFFFALSIFREWILLAGQPTIESTDVSERLLRPESHTRVYSISISRYDVANWHIEFIRTDTRISIMETTFQFAFPLPHQTWIRVVVDSPSVRNQPPRNYLQRRFCNVCPLDLGEILFRFQN